MFVRYVFDKNISQFIHEVIIIMHDSYLKRLGYLG